MSKQLIIVLCGKKQAGKNTACNFIVTQYLNKIRGHFPQNGEYCLDKNGHVSLNVYNEKKVWQHVTNQFQHEGVKVYSFADPLKAFCIDVLGVPYESCYGTDDQKNMPIEHILWDNLPNEIRRGKSGVMTGREIMQSVGTDICRRIYDDCWAKGTLNIIKKEKHPLALISDGRFPNEVIISKSFGAKTVKLKRNIYNDNHRSETALDDFDEKNFDLTIDNSSLSIEETCKILEKEVLQWMKLMFF